MVIIRQPHICREVILLTREIKEVYLVNTTVTGYTYHYGDKTN